MRDTAEEEFFFLRAMRERAVLAVIVRQFGLGFPTVFAISVKLLLSFIENERLLEVRIRIWCYVLTNS
jgi:hypothetical protein